jgi:AraC-like DNA-binding protein
MKLFAPSDTLDDLAPGDATRFWRVAHHADIECLTARFRKHVFPPHTHETYVVGTVVSGVNTYTIAGQTIHALPGQLCFVNPGEVHDATPRDNGYCYRMTYPTIAMLRSLVEEETGKLSGTPKFLRPVVDDPELAAEFIRAHRLLESKRDPLAADEALASVFTLMLRRYAKTAPLARGGSEPFAVTRVKGLLAGRLDEPPTLAELASDAGLSPFHLIRVFRKATGMTPSAWLADRRIHEACRQLRAGSSASEVALACGFFDQSHFSRVFKSRLGVTPGDFRSAGFAA